MTEDNQKSELQVSTKRGFPVYRSNPSVPDADSIKKQKRVRFGDDKKGFVVDTGSGEMISVGGAGFYEFEEVDNTRFVKLFLDGIKQAAGLSKAGLAVFELVYKQVQGSPGKDEIKLNQFLAADSNIPERNYQRGVRELLEKEFIYRSPSDGLFFVNIRYMFNGDRLAFVRGYRRKGSAPSTNQADLFSSLPEALPPPDGADSETLP